MNVLPKQVALLAWCTIVVALILGATVSKYPTPALLHNDISSPVLALELPPDGKALERVLGFVDAETLAELGIDEPIHPATIRDMFLWNTTLDGLFIPLYVGFVCWFAKLIGGGRLTSIAIALAVLAGVADYVEDFAILGVLYGATPSDAAATLIRVPALIKWAALNVALLLVALRLIRTYGEGVFSAPLGGLLGLLIAGSALLGIWGLFDYAHLEHSVTLFGGSVLVSGVRLWRGLLRDPAQGEQDKSGGLVRA